MSDDIRNKLVITELNADMKRELFNCTNKKVNKFLKENAITVDHSLSTIRFKVENRTGDRHDTHMEIITSPDSMVEVWHDSVKIRPLKTSGKKSVFELDITGNTHNIEIGYTSI